jgi:hypothetical protein
MKPDNGPLTDAQVAQLRETAEPELPTGKVVETSKLFEDPHPPGWMYDELQSNPLNEAEVEEVDLLSLTNLTISSLTSHRPEPVVFTPEYLDALAQDDDHDNHDPRIRAAVKQWKSENPDRTIKEERAKLARGKIDQLPWMQLIADNDLGREPTSGVWYQFSRQSSQRRHIHACGFNAQCAVQVQWCSLDYCGQKFN